MSESETRNHKPKREAKLYDVITDSWKKSKNVLGGITDKQLLSLSDFHILYNNNELIAFFQLKYWKT